MEDILSVGDTPRCSTNRTREHSPYIYDVHEFFKIMVDDLSIPFTKYQIQILLRYAKRWNDEPFSKILHPENQTDDSERLTLYGKLLARPGFSADTLLEHCRSWVFDNMVDGLAIRRADILKKALGKLAPEEPIGTVSSNARLLMWLILCNPNLTEKDFESLIYTEFEKRLSLRNLVLADSHCPEEIKVRFALENG